ncbi:glycosyltransferase [Aquabacterium sp. G14]|uniref:glycosyltransferase family 2 protein n=1 Tax=Aquabacterium sp. G14 TaxID=3130164 RepID=UPI00309BC2F0
MNDCRIAFLVSTFNMARYVEDMLDSVHQAMRTGDQLIVVDDGSTDDTYGVCFRWARRLCPEASISSLPNLGVCASRNAALAQASADYVLFLDGDDQIDPAAVSEARALLPHLRPDILEFDFQYWTTDEKRETIHASTPKSHHAGSLIENKDEILCNTLQDRAWALWGRMISHRLLYTQGKPLFPAELTIDDLPTTPRIAARANTLYYLQRPIIRYRSAPNSLSRQRSARHCLDISRATNFALQEIHFEEQSNAVKKAIRIWIGRTFYEALRMASQSPQCNIELFIRIFTSAIRDNHMDANLVIKDLLGTSNAMDKKIAKELQRFERHPQLQSIRRLIKSRLKSRIS